MGRVFAEEPVKGAALDWDCGPLVEEDGLNADALLLDNGVGVLTDSMKDERGPGVSTVGLGPV